MPRIVTGSFEDFAGASRGVSALVAEGFGHGEISIIALPASGSRDGPPPRGPGEARWIPLVIGTLGAMIGSGSAWAWAPPVAGAWLAWAPSLGALIGAGVGILAGALAGRRIRETPRWAEAVSVVVDDARAADVKAILIAHGARIERHAPGHRRATDRSRALRVIPFRP